MALKSAESVSTAPIVATGLIGGYLTARETGIRPLGGVVLALAGVLAARTWAKRSGVGAAVGLSALYVGAFGLSHPLAKKIGAWPAVLTVSAVSAGTAWAVSDRFAD